MRLHFYILGNCLRQQNTVYPPPLSHLQGLFVAGFKKINKLRIKIMKRFSSLFPYLCRAHMNIQPHLGCAPLRSNRCIREFGPIRMPCCLRSGRRRMQGVTDGEMCPPQPWWHTVNRLITSAALCESPG